MRRYNSTDNNIILFSKCSYVSVNLQFPTFPTTLIFHMGFRCTLSVILDKMADESKICPFRFDSLLSDWIIIAYVRPIFEWFTRCQKVQEFIQYKVRSIFHLKTSLVKNIQIVVINIPCSKLPLYWLRSFGRPSVRPCVRSFVRVCDCSPGGFDEYFVKKL